MMKYTRLLPKIRILIILLLIHVRPGIHQYILENTIAGPFVSQSKRIRNYSCFKPANVLVNESLLFPPHTSLLKVWLHIYIVGILYNFYLILIHFADSFHLSTEYLLCFYSKALKYDQHHEKRGTCPSQKSVYPTSVVSMPPSSGNSQCLTHFKVLCKVLYNVKSFTIANSLDPDQTPHQRCGDWSVSTLIAMSECSFSQDAETWKLELEDYTILIFVICYVSVWFALF